MRKRGGEAGDSPPKDNSTAKESRISAKINNTLVLIQIGTRHFIQMSRIPERLREMMVKTLS